MFPRFPCFRNYPQSHPELPDFSEKATPEIGDDRTADNFGPAFGFRVRLADESWEPGASTRGLARGDRESQSGQLSRIP
jgi:hypothetical protein